MEGPSLDKTTLYDPTPNATLGRSKAYKKLRADDQLASSMAVQRQREDQAAVVSVALMQELAQDPKTMTFTMITCKLAQQIAHALERLLDESLVSPP